MNPENNVIILKGIQEDRCNDIEKLENLSGGKLEVTFYDGRSYTYNQSNVEWFTKPKAIELSKFYVYYKEEIIEDYLQAFNFDNIYYKFRFANGRYAKIYQLS